MEYEWGWGSKVDSEKIFDPKDYGDNEPRALQAAHDFVAEFNSRNKEPVAPDWYMKALNPII